MRLHEHHLFPRDLERDFPLAVKGEGVWLWDSDGNRYLDGCSGANVTGIGHGVREIADALARVRDRSCVEGMEVEESLAIGQAEIDAILDESWAAVGA